MKISVFTPTYNSTATLQRAYESLENQTYKNFEWIIVDDFSSDNGATKKLIDKLTSKASFPCKTYFFNENHFGGKSLEKASELSSGEIIGTLDHDDQLTPTCLEKVAEYAENHFSEEDVSCIAGRCIDKNGNLIGKKFKKDISVHYDGYIRYKEGMMEELIVFSKTSVIKEYSKHMQKGYTYGLLWAKLSTKYKTVFVNDIFRIYDTSVATSYTNSKTLNTRFPEKHVEMNIIILDIYKKYLKYQLILTAKQLIHSNYLIIKHKIKLKNLQKTSSMIKALLYISKPLGYVKYIIRKLYFMFGL